MKVARCDGPISTSMRQTRTSDAAGHGDLVEGEEGLAGLAAPARMDRGLQGHSILQARTRPRRAGPARPPDPSVSTFERKPTLPRFTPSSGTSTSATARAARRNVPSPPRTTSASVPGSCSQQGLELAGRGRPVSRRPAPRTSPRRARAAPAPPPWLGCRRSRVDRASCPGQLPEPARPLVRQLHRHRRPRPT